MRPVSAIRILIVDDHAILREGVRALLKPHEDLEVVGEASDGQEALAAVARLDPDVVLHGHRHAGAGRHRDQPRAEEAGAPGPHPHPLPVR